MKAKSDAEDGLEIGCLMTGLLIRDNDDKDVMEIIAGIDMTENQKERMKQLFHQKTIAELFELYPRWCINKMDKPDEVCSTCIKVLATFTVPSRNLLFLSLMTGLVGTSSKPPL